MSNSTLPCQAIISNPQEWDHSHPSVLEEGMRCAHRRIDANYASKGETLSLNGLCLMQLPYGLESLKHLRSLQLNNNLLTSLPYSLKGLKNLTFLNVSNNKLTKLPNWVLDLRPGITVYISKNPFCLAEISRLIEITTYALYEGPKLYFVNEEMVNVLGASTFRNPAVIARNKAIAKTRSILWQTLPDYTPKNRQKDDLQKKYTRLTKRPFGHNLKVKF